MALGATEVLVYYKVDKNKTVQQKRREDSSKEDLHRKEDFIFHCKSYRSHERLNMMNNRNKCNKKQKDYYFLFLTD